MASLFRARLPVASLRLADCFYIPRNGSSTGREDLLLEDSSKMSCCRVPYVQPRWGDKHCMTLATFDAITDGVSHAQALHTCLCRDACTWNSQGGSIMMCTRGCLLRQWSSVQMQVMHHNAQVGILLVVLCLTYDAATGLAAYPSWQPTVRVLLTEALVPLLITDFCEEAGLMARNLLLAELQVTTKVDSLGVSKLQVNPFRRPVSCQGDDNCLPSYSNCFYFWCNAQAADSSRQRTAAGGMSDFLLTDLRYSATAL